MPTLTIHEAVLYGTSAFFTIAGGYLFYQYKKTLLNLKTYLTNPVKTKKQHQQAKADRGASNTQAGRDVIHNHYVPAARELTPMEQSFKEMAETAQAQANAKDEQLKAQNKQLKKKAELIERLLTIQEKQYRRIDELESYNAALLLDNHRLRENARHPFLIERKKRVA